MEHPWTVELGSGPLLATALHHGHDMLPDLAEVSALSVLERLREEDPHTGSIASAVPTRVVVDASRFTVDLNRPRDAAVYRAPEDAWGLNPWQQPPAQAVIADALTIHDDFYGLTAELIETTIEEHGHFVLYDVHSYNHRRSGPNAPPDDPAHNPTVNLGTGSLPTKWRPIAETFVATMSRQKAGGERIDTRENVRFQGGYFSQWVHDNYGPYGCVLAVDCKKVFMDEWTGEVDGVILAEFEAALAETGTPIIEALSAL